MTGTLSIRSRLSALFTGKLPEQAVAQSWPIGGAIGAAGVKITSDTALKIGAVWKAINLLSSSVGKLPAILYRRQGEGKTRDSSNPLYSLIRYNATPEISQMDLRQTVTAHALLHGNGYAYILRDPSTFQPLEIWPLSPSNTCAVRETDLTTGTSQVLYATYVNNQMFRLPAYNVIHIKGLGNDALTGYSVIKYFADDGSLTAGMRDYSAAFFRNGARPNVVLTHPGTLKPDSLERLKSSWANAHQGIGNAHGTAVLEEGMAIKEMQINARDAQLLEARNYQIRDIANWFSVPPHKLGDNSRIAYTSMEAENQSFLDESLDAWLIRWELEFRNKLLTEEQKRTDSHVIEFLRAALLRADMAARGQFYAQAVGGPWMTADEARAAENLNSIEGGSTLLRPLNMGGEPKASNMEDENMGGESGATPDNDKEEKESPT